MVSIEIKIPVLPESVADATIAQWHKKVGEAVKRDENLVDLETDKVILEVPCPVDGVLESIMVEEGATGHTNDVIALVSERQISAAEQPPAVNEQPVPETTRSAAVKPALAPVTAIPTAQAQIGDTLSPSERRKINSGEQSDLKPASRVGESTTQRQVKATREEQRVPMTRLRQRIAERLLTATQTTAMLTTFNEVNLTSVNKLRQAYKNVFEKKHGVRLGYMSFFTYAVVEALKRFPDVNAAIDGDAIVYHNYFDIGIAVSSERGLVVPIIRDANTLSFAEIERTIRTYAEKAGNNQITLEEMTGGTFTITNGGTFGSLLSTPIINPPQSAILGMHNIIERPVVENGHIVVCPMMYLALSYDHRIIDGKQSVLFLKTIKELLENPGRTLLAL